MGLSYRDGTLGERRMLTHGGSEGNDGKLIPLAAVLPVMENKDKCAHPSCRCNAKPGSKYCSTYCEGEAKTADILCSCGHTECNDK